jgi:hypothetical protein
MIRKGTKVEWNWVNGSATGKVKEVIKEEVSRTIKGSSVTRKGSEDNPALLIEQEDGREVLKLQSEVKRAD